MMLTRGRYEVWPKPAAPEVRSESEMVTYLISLGCPAEIAKDAAASQFRERRSLRKAEPPSTEELWRRLNELTDAIHQSDAESIGRQLRVADGNANDDIDEMAIIDAWNDEFGEDNSLRVLGADVENDVVYYLDARGNVVRCAYSNEDGNIEFDRSSRILLTEAEIDHRRSLAIKAQRARADLELQQRMRVLARGY